MWINSITAKDSQCPLPKTSIFKVNFYNYIGTCLMIQKVMKKRVVSIFSTHIIILE